MNWVARSSNLSHLSTCSGALSPSASRAASNCDDRCCTHCQRRMHRQRSSQLQRRVRQSHSCTRDSTASPTCSRRPSCPQTNRWATANSQSQSERGWALHKGRTGRMTLLVLSDGLMPIGCISMSLLPVLIQPSHCHTHADVDPATGRGPAEQRHWSAVHPTRRQLLEWSESAEWSRRGGR